MSIEGPDPLAPLGADSSKILFLSRMDWGVWISWLTPWLRLWAKIVRYWLKLNVFSPKNRPPYPPLEIFWVGDAPPLPRPSGSAAHDSCNN